MLSSNHPSPSFSELKTHHIWVFHDARLGHLSQLEGLAKRLAHHTACEFQWFDVTQRKLHLKHLLYSPKHLLNYIKAHHTPDLILGAGHATHVSMLIAGFKFNALTSVLMKPSLPRCFFNAIICPQHDGLGEHKKVLNTFSPLNKIDQEQVKQADKKRPVNLILIGGLSKHYHFDCANIITQIRDICLKYPHKQWLLSNSPRTPTEMNQALTRLSYPNLHIHDYQQDSFSKTDENLQDILLKTDFTWMTPDSMSMMFEALSAGSQLGFIDCQPKKQSRIVRRVENLLHEGYAITLNDTIPAQRNVKHIPWEADRAALWLVEQLHSKKLG